MEGSTLLSIDGIELSEWATRGISMTLRPLGGELARDVNGNLVDLTLDEHRKYAASVRCTDHEAPVLTNVWPGKQLVVELIPGLGVTNDTAEERLTLTMMVTSWETNRDEPEADTAWSIDLEEV